MKRQAIFCSILFTWIFIFGEHISFLLCCDNLLSYGTLCDLPQHCFLSYISPFHVPLLCNHFPPCFHMYSINIASNFILAQILCFSNMGLRYSPWMSMLIFLFPYICITSIKQHANSGSVCVCMEWSGNIQGCKLGYMFSESVWVSKEVIYHFALFLQ